MRTPNVPNRHQLLDGASGERRIIGVKTQNSHSRTVPTAEHRCTCMEVPHKDLTWVCGTSHHHHMGLLTLYDNMDGGWFVETLPCGTGVKACTVPVSLDAMALINV